MAEPSKPENYDELINILYAALIEPIGLLIKTNNARKARSAFYAARTYKGDPILDQLQFRTSPLNDGEIVICKSHPKELLMDQILDSPPTEQQ